MAKTVVCRILPTNASALQRNNQKSGANNVVILDIYPVSGSAAWQLSIARQHDLKLQFGDKIKCVSGTAGVLINPGTQAGMFILTKQAPPHSDEKIRAELEINDETTRHIQRGKITSAQDIGTLLRGTGAVTR